MAAEVSVESGAAASPIVGRETIEGVYEEEDHRLRKRTKTREWEWFPISDPKYDFEYPVPKFGEERGYGSFNLEYDAQNNPRFLWPFPNGIKPREQDYVPVHKLLFTPQRNFLINNSGHQVLSAHLENKVVGLFFPVDPIINTMLLSAWEELEDRHGEFEIVLVPRPYSEHSFTDSYGSLPWLSLSDTSSCQKLWWIYHPSKHQGFRSNSEEHPGVLVIIGRLHNRFCNYYAADILYKYGAEGYPFTLERAAELLEEKLEKLELGSLLGKEDLVCAADGKKLQRLVGWSRWMQDRFALDVEFI